MKPWNVAWSNKDNLTKHVQQSPLHYIHDDKSYIVLKALAPANLPHIRNIQSKKMWDTVSTTLQPKWHLSDLIFILVIKFSLTNCNLVKETTRTTSRKHQPAQSTRKPSRVNKMINPCMRAILPTQGVELFLSKVFADRFDFWFSCFLCYYLFVFLVAIYFDGLDLLRSLLYKK